MYPFREAVHEQRMQFEEVDATLMTGSPSRARLHKAMVGGHFPYRPPVRWSLRSELPDKVAFIGVLLFILTRKNAAYTYPEFHASGPLMLCQLTIGSSPESAEEMRMSWYEALTYVDPIHTATYVLMPPRVQGAPRAPVQYPFIMEPSPTLLFLYIREICLMNMDSDFGSRLNVTTWSMSPSADRKTGIDCVVSLRLPAPFTLDDEFDLPSEVILNPSDLFVSFNLQHALSVLRLTGSSVTYLYGLSHQQRLSLWNADYAMAHASTLRLPPCSFEACERRRVQVLQKIELTHPQHAMSNLDPMAAWPRMRVYHGFTRDNHIYHRVMTTATGRAPGSRWDDQVLTCTSPYYTKALKHGPHVYTYELKKRPSLLDMRNDEFASATLLDGQVDNVLYNLAGITPNHLQANGRGDTMRFLVQLFHGTVYDGVCMDSGATILWFRPADNLRHIPRSYDEWLVTALCGHVRVHAITSEQALSMPVPNGSNGVHLLTDVGARLADIQQRIALCVTRTKMEAFIREHASHRVIMTPTRVPTIRWLFDNTIDTSYAQFAPTNPTHIELDQQRWDRSVWRSNAPNHATPSLRSELDRARAHSRVHGWQPPAHWNLDGRLSEDEVRAMVDARLAAEQFRTGAPIPPPQPTPRQIMISCSYENLLAHFGLALVENTLSSGMPDFTPAQTLALLYHAIKSALDGLFVDRMPARLLVTLPNSYAQVIPAMGGHVPSDRLWNATAYTGEAINYPLGDAHLDLPSQSSVKRERHDGDSDEDEKMDDAMELPSASAASAAAQQDMQSANKRARD